MLIPRGGAVKADSGVLFLDPATGGGELWQLPDGASPGRVSPDGRFIAWYEVTDRATNAQTAHVLDTFTGLSRKSEYAGASLGANRFSPDGSRFAGLAGRTLVLAESASGSVIQVLDLAGTARPFLQAEWSPDGTGLAAALFNNEKWGCPGEGALGRTGAARHLCQRRKHGGRPRF